jgi:hypothetical protein
MAASRAGGVVVSPAAMQEPNATVKFCGDPAAGSVLPCPTGPISVSVPPAGVSVTWT